MVGSILSGDRFVDEVVDGVRDVLPITLAVLPFAGVYGALATEQGWSLGEILLASMTIYAGASQYAMLDLLGQGVPAWSIVLTVFAINFRHVLYSASIGRKLGSFSLWQKVLAFFMLVDIQFAAAETRATRRTIRPAYYFAYAVVLYSSWLGANVLGALFGALIENPDALGFDFILPLYFTGMVVGFHKRPNFLPIMLVSICCSLVAWFAVGSPWHISIGGLAGLLLAAMLSKPPASHQDSIIAPEVENG
ncbi:MAG: AzlC family ABC transporter permease [Rhizobiaceae bacterium]